MAKLNADLSDLILDLLRHTAPVSSKVIHESLDKSIGYATIKRAISKLLADRLIATKGKGKSTVYFLSPVYSLLRPISTDQYFRNEIDDREIISGFNQTLISEVLPLVSIFTSTEMKFLEGLQNIFEKNKSDLSEAEYKSEFERLAIDLSWKSSQIEGNTYSLLETERLLREHETASGKT